MDNRNTSILLSLWPNSTQKRIHPSSLLLEYPDKLKQLDKNYNTTYDPLIENLRQSVLHTDRFLQFVRSIHSQVIERNTVALQKKYPNDSAEQISARLQDCEKSILTRVTKTLEKYYPSDVVDCAMDVYEYRNKMNSNVTYNQKYRKLEIAIFRHQGTVEERLLIQTKANFRRQIESDIRQPISNENLQQLLDLHTDNYDIIAEHRLTTEQLSRLSPAEVFEYDLRKNNLIDSIIENKLIEIGCTGEIDPSKVTKKDQHFFNCFLDEFWDSWATKEDNQESGELHPIATYKQLRNVVDHNIHYKNVNMDVNDSYDTKERNLRQLALRPDIPVYFDKIGKAHLRRTGNK